MKSKTMKLLIDGQGSYLGMEKGCFSVKDKNRKVSRYPLFESEIGEVVLKSGNAVLLVRLLLLGSGDRYTHYDSERKASRYA